MEYVLKNNACCKKYRYFKVLNSLSMGVPKGSIYSFAGKNNTYPPELRPAGAARR